MYVDEREELQSRESAASDLFHWDPLEHQFLPKDSNAYQHHLDVLMLHFLTPIKTDFPAAHRQNVHWRDYAFDAVIVNTAPSIVTAEAVRFALQSTLADGQYVHQHLCRLQDDSPTATVKILNRYGFRPGPDNISAIMVARTLSIADTPWWQIHLRTGQFFYRDAASLAPARSMDALLVNMMHNPSRQLIDRTFGTIPYGSNRVSGTSTLPERGRWVLGSIEPLPAKTYSFPNTSAPSREDVVIPTFD